VALTFAVLARYVSGSLPLLLLPLFSLSLWLGTISLLILAASLFTLAHIRGWSLLHEKHYRAFDSEERASCAFLNELQPDSATQHQRALAMLPAHSDHPRFDGRAALPAIALIAFALSSNTACSPAVTSADSTPPSQTGGQAASLHIYIDWSGSLTRPAMEEAWTTIKEELPQIAEHHRVSSLEISRFDEDGWCPERLIELQLPVFTEPARVKLAATEWDSFANIRDAVHASEEETWQRERNTAHAHYEKALREAVQKLTGADVLPPADFETRQSYPVGLLRRIAENTGTAPRVRDRANRLGRHAPEDHAKNPRAAKRHPGPGAHRPRKTQRRHPNYSGGAGRSRTIRLALPRASRCGFMDCCGTPLQPQFRIVLQEGMICQRLRTRAVLDSRAGRSAPPTVGGCTASARERGATCANPARSRIAVTERFSRAAAACSIAPCRNARAASSGSSSALGAGSGRVWRVPEG
jgi:hypothetical protein